MNRIEPLLGRLARVEDRVLEHERAQLRMVELLAARRRLRATSWRFHASANSGLDRRSAVDQLLELGVAEVVRAVGAELGDEQAERALPVREQRAPRTGP